MYPQQQNIPLSRIQGIFQSSGILFASISTKYSSIKAHYFNKIIFTSKEKNSSRRWRPSVTCRFMIIFLHGHFWTENNCTNLHFCQLNSYSKTFVHLIICQFTWYKLGILRLKKYLPCFLQIHQNYSNLFRRWQWRHVMQLSGIFGQFRGQFEDASVSMSHKLCVYIFSL